MAGDLQVVDHLGVMDRGQLRNGLHLDDDGFEADEIRDVVGFASFYLRHGLMRDPTPEYFRFRTEARRPGSLADPAGPPVGTGRETTGNVGGWGVIRVDDHPGRRSATKPACSK